MTHCESLVTQRSSLHCPTQLTSRCARGDLTANRLWAESSRHAWNAILKLDHPTLQAQLMTTRETDGSVGSYSAVRRAAWKAVGVCMRSAQQVQRCWPGD